MRGRCTDGGGKADHNKADAGAQDTTPAVPTSDVAGSIWPYEGSASPRTTNFGVTASCSITSSSNSRPVVASHILCRLVVRSRYRLSNYRLTTSTAAEDAKLGCQRSQVVAYIQRRAQRRCWIMLTFSADHRPPRAPGRVSTGVIPANALSILRCRYFPLDFRNSCGF